MPWYRCEARGREAASAGIAFAATRFVEADAEEAAIRSVRKSIGRELVRRGIDPLSAEACVAVETVKRVDEDDVPGIVAPDMIWLNRA
jgi:hypothetical protein